VILNARSTKSSVTKKSSSTMELTFVVSRGQFEREEHIYCEMAFPASGITADDLDAEKSFRETGLRGGRCKENILQKETHDTKGEIQQRCDRSEREILENFFLQLVWYIVRSPIVEYCN
jgi:hypothetical protein